MPEPDGLWVRSEVMPNGTYGVALNVGDDRSWALSRDRAVAYAAACVAVATAAEHDAAVFNLLTKQVGLPRETVGAVLVNDIHPDRPEQHAATDPLRFATALGLKHGPFLKMTLDGKPAGELTPADLRDHALGVLKVIAAADLDAALHRALVGPFGLDDDRARQIIGSLANHWPAERSPRRDVA